MPVFEWDAASGICGFGMIHRAKQWVNGPVPNCFISVLL